VKTTTLRDAIVLALVAGATGWMSPVLAQQATDLDRVSVTGSRIQTSQTVTASAPVAEISAEEFKFAGSTRVEDLVNQYPQMAQGFDTFTANPTTGYPTANLRGLGSSRTLVLVNGQRLPSGSSEGAADLTSAWTC